jgi:Tfp pilus assembly protein PilO
MSPGTFRSARSWQVDAGAVLVILALVGAWYSLLVRPILARRADAESAAEQLESRKDSVARLRAERQDVEKALAAARDEVARQSVQLEPRSRVNQRLDSLTSLAQSCGIDVEKLAPGATAESARHGTMSLRLTGRAPYSACQDLVQQLHERFNDTALTSLRLASAPGSADEPVTIDLELLWFTAPDVKPDAQKPR